MLAKAMQFAGWVKGQAEVATAKSSNWYEEQVEKGKKLYEEQQAKVIEDALKPEVKKDAQSSNRIADLKKRFKEAAASVR